MTTLNVTHLPRVQVSNLTQLQWAVTLAHAQFEETKANTMAAWKMFDDAIEDNDKEATDNCHELALFCEDVQKLAWHEWDTAKRVLLVAYS